MDFAFIQDLRRQTLAVSIRIQTYPGSTSRRSKIRNIGPYVGKHFGRSCGHCRRQLLDGQITDKHIPE